MQCSAYRNIGPLGLGPNVAVYPLAYTRRLIKAINPCADGKSACTRLGRGPLTLSNVWFGSGPSDPLLRTDCIGYERRWGLVNAATQVRGLENHSLTIGTTVTNSAGSANKHKLYAVDTVERPLRRGEHCNTLLATTVRLEP